MAWLLDGGVCRELLSPTEFPVCQGKYRERAKIGVAGGGKSRDMKRIRANSLQVITGNGNAPNRELSERQQGEIGDKQGIVVLAAEECFIASNRPADPYCSTDQRAFDPTAVTQQFSAIDFISVIGAPSRTVIVRWRA
jgi:hypothetical protein